MVGGLKVLRHKRTEAGYFNEFLIAKTPDDVENCLPLVGDPPQTTLQQLQQQQSTFLPATSMHNEPHHLCNPSNVQASMYSGSAAVDVIVSSVPASSAPDWHHQQQQQQLTLLCFGNPEVEQQIVTQPDTLATTAIARQEVVVTSGYECYQGAYRPDAGHRSDMAAGMSKMRLEHNSSCSSSSTSGGCSSSAPSTSRQRPAAATADAAASAAQPSVSSSELQRRANKRRERNRAAAARCRKKRQDQLESLAETVRSLEAENSSLESRVADLAAARSDLLHRLRDHRPSCPDTSDAEASALYASLAMASPDVALGADCDGADDEVLLTPSLLLPPPLASPSHPDDFKLEPL